MQKYKSRSDVPDKYKWDLTDMFKDENEFEESFKKASDMVDDLKNYVGCTKDMNLLYEFLNKDINTITLVERLYIYSYLINDQELGISSSISRKNKCEDLINKYSLNVSFFNPELLKLNKDEYNNLFNNDKLNEFKYLLDDIYRHEGHILSENEENIINNLNSSMNHFEDMSSTMLNSEHDYGTVNIDGEEEKIQATNLRRLLKNNNRDIRKNVREKYNKVLGQYGDTSAELLNGYVKSNIVISKLHHFNDAWNNKLFELKMPNEVFKTLIDTCENHLDSLQRYFDLYKKYLGFDDLYQYDLNLDLAKSNKEYSIEDAQKLCLNALKPLGKNYLNHFKKIFDNHYIDYAQYPNKCSGGYSFAPNDRNSRILMSYNYDLESVSTIIHEGGHNVHHQYICENNKAQYRDVSSLICEVASLTNECLLSSYLAKNGENKEEKLAGIANILGVIESNFFGAVREGHMELDFYNYVNEGNSITKDYMNELTLNSLKKYYGNVVKLDEYSSYSWERRSHYYMNYYLFSYAICISAASYVAREILLGNSSILDKYIKFLSTGSNVDVMDAFKILGIDLSDSNVYENAIKYFDSLIDEFIKISKEV